MMYQFTARQNDLVGVLVVHAKNREPLMVGDSVLSKLLYQRYVDGFKFAKLVDYRKKNINVRKKDLNRFKQYCKEYFENSKILVELSELEDKYYRENELQIGGQTINVLKGKLLNEYY